MAEGVHFRIGGNDASSWENAASYALKNICGRDPSSANMAGAEKALKAQNEAHLKGEGAYRINLSLPSGADHRFFSKLRPGVEIYVVPAEFCQKDEPKIIVKEVEIPCKEAPKPIPAPDPMPVPAPKPEPKPEPVPAPKSTPVPKAKPKPKPKPKDNGGKVTI
ncbi:hypothetical protein HZC34_06800 [Candidatus Saganbacteria bacterium]|nr:hypothetical protein [Candidatus Saganbacteria bacterium]